METKSPGTPQRCRLILNQCLAIQLSRPGNAPEDFWMYDSGYMIFQNFLAANAQCWWNGPLTAATRALKYIGHVSPGILLVTAEPCALEVLRGAYARSVLKPPPTYIISSVGDIDDCIVTPIAKGQFTPLPEALCDVIMDLTTQGQSATIENVKIKLTIRFPHMQTPSVEVIYDTLVQLMQERKIYQTAKGFFIVTPDRRRRSRSRPRDHRSLDEAYEDEPQEARTILLTNSEALHSLYGEISTERDGDLTHQCIQTNLADVICGGNPNDKIMYARSSKRRSASFPAPRSLERRHSMRLFGSSKRLQRCSSTRSLTKTYALAMTADSSSSENQSTDSSSPKKGSLLSRLFRRSGRSKQRQIETFSAQFPPLEWFNSRAVHLHSVGTQTTDHDVPMTHTLSNSTFYDGSELSQRSSTLPRRHRRHMSSESTFLIWSRDCSPIRRRSPAYCSGSLPRSTHSIPSSVKPTAKSLASKSILDEQNRVKAKQRIDDPRHFRHLHSGPSSIESGKTSLLSGPSSIDSGKMTLSRTSGHSSLDSQASTSSRPPKVTISPRSSPSHQKVKPHLRQTTSTGSSTKGEEVPVSRVAGSTSNNSITLQVTTSGNVATPPSTKIYVQNSPIRSVITLENGKLSDNPNVFIINNETVKTANGELIQRHLKKIPPPLETQFDDSETGDSLSLISENSPNSSVTPLINEILDAESTKFTKNVNNDATMNNSRKMGNQCAQNGRNIVYKNVLKSNESDPTSPVNNKNVFRFSDEVAGSMGNLRIVDKLNSNCDLKNLQLDRKALTSSPAINTDSLAHILQKNIVAVGSEPNLVAKNTDCKKVLDKSNIDKEQLDRRLSLSKETPATTSGDLYNFPSLTDLSFNFTSLAAQKILQGVSINSIDTLVELNMANSQDKSKPGHLPSLCTDYGMI